MQIDLPEEKHNELELNEGLINEINDDEVKNAINKNKDDNRYIHK